MLANIFAVTRSLLAKVIFFPVFWPSMVKGNKSRRNMVGADEMQFKDRIETALSISSLTAKDLATEFEVSETTVRRWLHGSATPHKIQQDAIISYILRFEKSGDSNV